MTSPPRASLAELHRGDFVNAHAFLRRAHECKHRDQGLLAVTLNNLACYRRRRGHLPKALAHLERAVEIEAHLHPSASHQPADTHLNLCAVLSEMGNHPAAMYHGKLALKLLRDELAEHLPVLPRGFPISSVEISPHLSPGSEEAAAPRASGHFDFDVSYALPDVETLPLMSPQQQHEEEHSPSPPPPPPSPPPPPPPTEPQQVSDRMAVLAVAHHNLAVEQEAMGLHEEAARSFADAAAISTSRLGNSNPITASLKAAHEANVLRLTRSTNSLHSLSTGRSKSELRRAAELRQQQSVERHVEIARSYPAGNKFLDSFDRLRLPPTKQPPFMRAKQV
jgi:tetratricopeptide (TPR) repeat protein